MEGLLSGLKSGLSFMRADPLIDVFHQDLAYVVKSVVWSNPLVVWTNPCSNLKVVMSEVATDIVHSRDGDYTRELHV
jgi:hypothetical protein